MKPNPLKILVLLFSISAAGVYVWHASRTKPTQTTQPPTVSEEPAAPATNNDFTEPMPARVVSEEEIQAVRESMLSTSKSGLIMSDKDIRRMLETQPPPKKPAIAIQPSTLMGSSKNPHRVIPIEDVKQLIEPENQPTGQSAEPPSE